MSDKNIYKNHYLIRIKTWKNGSTLKIKEKSAQCTQWSQMWAWTDSTAVNLLSFLPFKTIDKRVIKTIKLMNH